MSQEREKDRAESSDLLGLPTPTDADLEALRRVRRTRLGLRRVTRLQAALPPPSAEQLARRRLFRGDPFKLPKLPKKKRDPTRE